MLYISTELARIAQENNVAYIRAIDENDLNIATHYKDSSNTIIAYVGEGEIDNTFEGAQPLAAVTTTIYILKLADNIDILQESADLYLTDAAALAGVIVNDLVTERDTLTYKLEAVKQFDDLLIGYKMTVVFIVDGNAC